MFRNINGYRRSSQFLKAIVASLLVGTLFLADGVQATLAAPPVKPTLKGAEAIFIQGTKEFMQAKQLKGGGYNWSDNGCSVPTTVKIVAVTSNFAAKYFKNQCIQHDFGYANFGRLDPTENRRKWVDDHFYSRMVARCGDKDIVMTMPLGALPSACLAHASAFYAAVRKYGKSHFSQ